MAIHDYQPHESPERGNARCEGIAHHDYQSMGVQIDFNH